MTPQLTTAIQVGAAIMKLTPHPMNDLTSKVMLQLILAGEEFTFPSEPELPFIVAVAKKRCEHHAIPASDGALLMIAQLCDRPGTVVMYCAVLKALATKLNRAVQVPDLCDAFPMGFPNNDDLITVWDQQKVHDGAGPNNALDRASAWV